MRSIPPSALNAWATMKNPSAFRFVLWLAFLLILPMSRVVKRFGSSFNACQPLLRQWIARHAQLQRNAER